MLDHGTAMKEQNMNNIGAVEANVKAGGGSYIMPDISMPIAIDGRHWGALRIGSPVT